MVGDGAGGEPPDRAVRGGVGVVKLSHAGAHRVDLVGVFRAGGFGADQGAAGLGEGDELAGLVGFAFAADDQRHVLAVDDLGEGAVRFRGDRAVRPAGQDLDDRAGGRAGLAALPGRQGAAGDLAERGAELLLKVPAGGDSEVAGPVHPAGLERAEDVLGVVVEVGVDARGLAAAGDGQRPGLLPGFRAGERALAVGDPPADDDIGDHAESRPSACARSTGRRTMPIRSSSPARVRRKRGLTASAVYRLVMKAHRPPGATRVTPHLIAWSCRENLVPGLSTSSGHFTSLKGTLPTKPSAVSRGTRTGAADWSRTRAKRGSETEPVRISASGCSSWAIRAVAGSSSTPVMRMPAGANAANWPEPAPGSTTVPWSRPSFASAW